MEPIEYMGVVIVWLTALLMVGIGVYQLRSQKPVGFYSGEKPPEPEELTDVRAWNQKHGKMWVSYGIIIVITSVIALFMMETPLCLIPFMGGLVLPIFWMIRYHNQLKKEYYRGPVTPKK